jgi:hypothetical protein
METTPLRVEDRLDGASIFISWKERVTLVLKEYELWELVDKSITPPTYMTPLDAHKKKDIKVERVILYYVKDHLIPPLNEKNTTKEIFDALVILFKRKNMNKNIVSRNKLRLVQMYISNNFTIYLMRITQVQY